MAAGSGLAFGFLMALALAVLPDEFPQGIRVGLRPNCTATEAGVAFWVKLCAVLEGDGEKPETLWAEHDVGEILLARSCDFALHSLGPTALETLGHMIWLTLRMSRDEQRVAGARFQCLVDRAARHRLNPLVGLWCSHPSPTRAPPR